MSSIKALTLLFLVLVPASPAFSQEQKLSVNKDGQLELTPEMEENAWRRIERLRDPSFIKLEIEPVSKCPDEEAKKVSDCYKARDKIELKLFMTNTSSEAIFISVNINSPYEMNSVQLFRDGELVPYRDRVDGIIKKPSPFVSLIRVQLEPGKKEMATTISLEEWYGPLEPGRYQLDIKRRFLPDGGWTETASTTFEVEPE